MGSERRDAASPDGQLALLEQPPAVAKLTTRQAFALKLVQEAAGGIYSEEVGAAWCAQRGKHGPDERCAFDGSSGQQVLAALKRKGLVRERRPRGASRYWEAVGADASAAAQDDGWQRLIASGF